MSTSQSLEEKLRHHFGDRINIQKGKTKRGNLLFSKHLSVEKAMRKEHSMKSKLNVKIRDVAFALRLSIAEAEHKPLPPDITVADILYDEVNVPDEVNKFFIWGPDNRTLKSNTKQRRINSISEDFVFAVTSGRKKPAKHLKVGLTVKRLTGSKKLIEMLNRLGHSVSYSTLEELETEMAFTATKESRVTPQEIKFVPHLCTGIAWDNYDPFVETLNGQNTLHDTVVIAYQSIIDEQDIEVEEEEEEINDQPLIEENCSTTGHESTCNIQQEKSQIKRRRRAFETTGLDLEPYHKKQRMQNRVMLPLKEPRR